MNRLAPFPPGLLPGLLLALLPTLVHGVSEENRWQENIPVTASQPELHIRNVWGPVLITAHAEQRIEIKAVEIRRALSDASLERSRERLFVNLREQGGGVALRIGSWDEHDRRWDCRGCELHLALDIRVPAGTRVDAATVMDGDLIVEGLAGPVSAHNVNGNVYVSGTRNCGRFGTVNGEVEVRFDRSPEGECHFETVNGDMVVYLPEAHARMGFELMNGEIRSDFAVQPLVMPARVERSESGQGTRYTIRREPTLQLGNGSARFHFESINGDVHLRRR